MSVRVPLVSGRASFNFIVREYRKRVTYLGSQIDNELVVIVKQGSDNPPEVKTVKLPTQSQCALLVKDDTLLLLGCIDKKIIALTLADPENPKIILNIDTKEMVTSLVALDPNTFFCG